MKKTFTHISRKIYAIMALAGATFIVSCSSDPVEQVNTGSFSTYNFSPTFGTFDAYIDGAKFNSSALPFGGGVKYARLTAGTHDVKFTVAGETAAAYEANGLEIGKDVGNTLYLVGTAPSFDKVYTKDDYPNAVTTKSYIRFINLSPDAPALDLVMNTDTTITTGKAYKSYSEFTPVNPSAKVFAIKQGNNVLATLESTKLSGGYFYTIVSKGKLTPGNLEREFAGQIILHQ